MQDRNFDDLSQRFARNIYGSAKGEIRLAVIWQQLSQHLPQLLSDTPLRILDAGCGFGQVGATLAGLGHQVVFSDVSEQMLEGAKAHVAAHAPAAHVQFIHAPVQALDAAELGQFDLVIFHAVLEWLAEPKHTLQHVTSLVAAGGHLSLMFYNRDALIYRNLIRGNWRWVENGDLQGEEGGLTPYYPLGLSEVEQWLSEWHMPVKSRAGVRVIYDYMEKKLRDSRPIEDIIRVELQYATSEPYLHMGRYLHLLVAK